MSLINRKQMADNKYFVGQVADLLGGKKIKSEPVTPQKTKLAALFDVKTKEKIDVKKKVKSTPEKKVKKLKRSKTIESVKTEMKTEKDVKEEKVTLTVSVLVRSQGGGQASN